MRNEEGERPQVLRGREPNPALSKTEPDRVEETYLYPARERLRREREEMETLNRTLEILIRRKEALAVRLKRALAEA
jgi:hypothetical protein